MSELQHEAVRGMVRDIAPQLKPHDDWAPVAFIRLGESLSVVQLPGEAMNSESGKQLLAEALGMMARGSDALSFVMSVWLGRVQPTPEQSEKLRAGVDTYDDLDMPRPSEQADRQEGVVVHTFSADGVHASYAQIERHDGAHPTLGDWEDWDAREGVLGGRFAQAIRGAFAS